MDLPRYFALKSKRNEQYLRLVNKADSKNRKQSQPVDGYLSFSAEEIISPFTKFEFVAPTNGDANGIYHLRCCYHQKLWRIRNPTFGWIAADADNPEEEESNELCSLFEVERIRGSSEDEIRVKHQQSGCYLSVWGECLKPRFETPGEEGAEDVFTLIDWGKLLTLPQYVAFKFNDGKYLSAYTSQGYPYLTFSSEDKKDSTVLNEVSYTKDGGIRIKSHHFGKFWRCSSHEWIMPDYDADKPESDPEYKNTVFRGVKVSDKLIVLRNMGNNKYCGSWSDYLSASFDPNSASARLEVEEPVVSRRVYDVRFHMTDFNPHKEKPRGETKSMEKTNTVSDGMLGELEITIEKTEQSSWTRTFATTLGIEFKLESKVPLLVTNSIQIAYTFTGEYSWGGTKTFQEKLTAISKFPVPLNTTVRATAAVYESNCSIPFSYTQTDTLANGNTITYKMNDGLYNGKKVTVRFAHEKIPLPN